MCAQTSMPMPVWLSINFMVNSVLLINKDLCMNQYLLHETEGGSGCVSCHYCEWYCYYCEWYCSYSYQKDVALISLANILHRARYSNEAAILVHSALDLSRELNVNHFTLGNIYAVSIYCTTIFFIWVYFLQIPFMLWPGSNSLHDCLKVCQGLHVLIS